MYRKSAAANLQIVESSKSFKIATGKPQKTAKPFRDDAMDKLLEEARRQGISLSDLANRAMISPTTIYNWANLKTRYAQHMTLKLVAKPLGLQYQLVRFN